MNATAKRDPESLNCRWDYAAGPVLTNFASLAHYWTDQGHRLPHPRRPEPVGRIRLMPDDPERPTDRRINR